MYNKIVIDSNNLFWRCVTTTIKNQIKQKEDIIYTLAIQSTFSRIKQLKNQFGYKDCNIYLCFDNPISAYEVRRVISHGTYKHTRENKNIPPQLYDTLDIFMDICKCYSNNFHIVKNEKLEADDLTIILQRQFPDDKLLFISADLDWARNINNNSHWFNFHTLYSVNNFIKKYGFSPVGNKIKIYKAIHGDNSDCISNAVPYLPKEFLLKIVNESEILKDIYNVDIPQKWINKINDAYLQIEENYALVDFVEINLDYNDIVTNCKENIKQLRRWYQILNIPFEERMYTKEDPFFSVKEAKKLKVIGAHEWKG